MKKLFVSVLILVVLAVGFILLAPTLVTIEAVRRSIAHEVAGWSGRALTFEGTPTVSFGPYVTVTFPKVTIGSSIDDKPLVVMDSLSAELKILPLFYGGLEVSGLRFEHPVFRLRVQNDGSTNWALPRVLAGTSDLGSLTIVNGMVDYQDASGQTLEAENIGATLSWPDTASPIALRGNAVWQGEAIDFNGSLGSPSDLADGAPVPVRLAIASTPLRASFNGTLRNIDGLQATGALSLTTPSFRKLATLLGQPMADGSTLGAASIDADASLTRRFMTLSNAKFSLDGNDGEGAFGIDMSGSRAAVQGTLAFDSLDLSAYSEALQSLLRGARDKPDEPLGLGLLDDNDVDLRISASQLVLGNARFQRVAASTAVRDGRLDLSIGDGVFEGGRISASLIATIQDNDASLSFQGRIDNVALRQALSDVTGITALDGTGTGTFGITARGSTWNELSRSLAGTADATVTDGVINGINLGALSSGDPGKLAGNLLGGSTAFSSASGKFAVASDHITASAVNLAGTGYALQFSGEAPLQGSEISGRGTVTVGAANASPKTSIPFLLGGTWTAPRLVPDFSGLGRKASVDPIRTAPRRQPNFLARFAHRIVSVFR